MIKTPILRLASKGPVVIYPSSTIKASIQAIVDNGLRRLPVVDPGTKKLRGVVSSMDFVDFLGGGNKYNIIKKDFEGNLFSAINSPVSKIMTEKVVYFKDTEAVGKAAEKMLKTGTGGCPVVDGSGRVEAIVSERDFIEHLADVETGIKVSEVMTKDLVTITPGTSLGDATRMMVNKGFRRLPVMSGGEVVGILRTYEVLRFIADNIFAKFSTIDADEILARERVGDIMNVAVTTVRPDQDIGIVASIMVARRFGGLVVEENGKMIGLVTEADIFRAVYS